MGTLVGALLRARPEDRPATAAVATEILDGSRSVPPGPMFASSTPLPPPVAPPRPPPRWPLVAAVVVLVVMVVAVLAALVT